jgi:hypothetical protein
VTDVVSRDLHGADVTKKEKRHASMAANAAQMQAQEMKAEQAAASSDESADESSEEDETLSGLMGGSLSADLLSQLQALPSSAHGWVQPPFPDTQPPFRRGDSVGMRGRTRRQPELVLDGLPKVEVKKEGCDCCGSPAHGAWRRMVDALLDFRLDDWHLAQLSVFVDLEG